MRTFSLLAILATAPALAAPVSQGPVKKSPEAAASQCLNDKARFAGENLKAETRKLADLPAGNLSIAVAREVGGCQSATVVRYGYGAGSEGPRPASEPRPLR